MRFIRPLLLSLAAISVSVPAAELFLEDILPVGDDKIITLDNGFPIQSPTYRRAGYNNDGTYEARTFDRKYAVRYTTRHMDNDRESLSVAQALVRITDPDARQSYIDKKLDIATKSGHTFEKTAYNVWETVDFMIAELEDGVQITFKNAPNAERDTAIVRHHLYPVLGPLKLNETKAERVIERLQGRNCVFQERNHVIETSGRCLGFPSEKKAILRINAQHLTQADIEMEENAYATVKARLDDEYRFSEKLAQTGDMTEGMRFFTYEPPESMREKNKHTALEVILTRRPGKTTLSYVHPIGHWKTAAQQQAELAEKIQAYRNRKVQH